MGPLLTSYPPKKVFVCPGDVIFTPNAELIKIWLRNAGHSVVSSCEQCDLQVVFMSRYKMELGTTPTVLVSSEQPGFDGVRNGALIQTAEMIWCMDVVDLNFYNVEFNVPMHKLFIVPVMIGTYVCKKPTTTVPKDVHVLHFGATHTRRVKIIEQLKATMPTKCVMDVSLWGTELSDMLDRTQVVVVPHYYEEPNTFAVHRIMNIMQHSHVRVVAEESFGSVHTRTLLKLFGKRIVFAPYEDITTVVADSVHHWTDTSLADDDTVLQECISKLYAWDGQKSWLECCNVFAENINTDYNTNVGMASQSSVALVTFIIPSINRPTLINTLLSLTSQTDHRWTAVVAFDGISPDPSHLVLDARISYIFLETKLGCITPGSNGRGGQVRNYAIQNSTTADWLAFVDDDDTLDINYVKTLQTQMSMHESDCFIFTMQTKDGTFLPPPACTTFSINAVGISFAYKRRRFDEGFKFYNSFSEDYDLLHSMRLKNVPITIVREVMYYVGGVSCAIDDLEVIRTYQLQFSDKARAYVDVGAYTGSTFVSTSHLFNSSVVYEPKRDHFAILCETIAKSSSKDGCIVKNVACGSAHNVGTMVQHGQQPGAYFFQRCVDGKVKMVTLDGDTDVASLDVDFLKIEAEGKELAVLQGARETILRSKPLVALTRSTSCQTLFGTSQMASTAYLTQLGAVRYRTTASYTYFYFPPRIIRTFWTDGSELSGKQKTYLLQLQAESGVHVELYTAETAQELELEHAPFHPAYRYLSDVHRSDFLRTYCMHFYGGGFSDIRPTADSWIDAFEKIKLNPSVWVVGYVEIKGGVGYTPLDDMWASLIGNCAYVFKEKSPLTKEWYGQMTALLNERLVLLRLHRCAPAFCTYPIGAIELLGEIFHRVVWSHISHVNQTLPLPDFTVP